VPPSAACIDLRTRSIVTVTIPGRWQVLPQASRVSRGGTVKGGA
jgi:hypothetical protein